nr:MAG TPA: tail protein [Caudoviricetes sp.]
MAPVLKLAAGFAAMENGTVQLRGIVDEYEVELGGGGLTVTLSGRGYAARLLDNESRPVTYEQVTLRELIRCHAEPYGITCGAAADLRSTVPYTAGAGVSQWKVISEFCRTCGGFLPRFAKTGELLAVPEKDDGKRIVIDDSSPVLECRIREDHYGVLTEALVIDKKQNVSYSVQNPKMIAKGGQCRRVIYTPGRSTWDAMRYTGEYQISQSRQEEAAVSVKLPGSFGAFPGDRVALKLEKLGTTGLYRVVEAENRFSVREGAVMIWTLKECE